MSTVGFDSADFPVLSVQPPLERPASPVGAEDQQATKKVKNKDLSKTADVSMQEEDGVATHTMQVDGTEGSHGLPNSYAAAVARPRTSKASAKKVLNPDDIVVLDEDVNPDVENKTPSMQEKHSFPFSGSERQEVAAEELYGPWMLTSDKRRRSRRLNDTGKVADPTVGKSHFDVLTSDDTEELIPSDVASLVADPRMGSDVSPPVSAENNMSGGRRGAKKGGNSGNQVNWDTKGDEFTVEPMVPGITPTVVDGSSGAKGRHQAVTIIEDGTDMGGGKGGGLKKHSPGVSKLKLQVRKQSDFKAPNLPLLSEWVNSLSSGGNVVKHVPRIVNSSTSQADPPDTTHALPVVHKTGPDIGYSGSKLLSPAATAAPSAMETL
ncbi:hypothetical protein V6N13_074954 [Hibiscus sabdariffa]